eukprot:gb/GECG01005755.1/.p1 GENE.gb/GECG01005755.1/~~gb/GECG01005755.1/.p1  ORF type:complete len:573 (+),score=56.39 gb/GECG01005755.1/:1-1719(+)
MHFSREEQEEDETSPISPTPRTSTSSNDKHGCVWPQWCHKTNKWILFPAACFQALTASVVVFGWPNIEPVLVDKGVFASRCEPGTIRENGQCDAQLEALALVFTVSSAVSFVFNLINGLLLDRVGVRVTVAFGLILWTLGLLLLTLGSIGYLVNIDYSLAPEELAAKSQSTSESLVFFLGFSLLGAGSVATLHPTYSIGNLFRRARNSVVTTINGFADSSAVMFLIVRLIYFGGSFALSTIFLGYILGPILIGFLFVAFLWPQWPFKSETERHVESTGASQKTSRNGAAAEEATHSENSNNSAGTYAHDSETREVELTIQVPRGPDSEDANKQEVQEPTGVNRAEEEVAELYYPHLGKRFSEQATTWRFVGGAAFTWINILKFNYFFVSLNSLLEELGDTDGTYTQLFGWISLAGVGAVFVTGTIIDKFGLVGGFWGSNISGILLSALSLIPVLELQVLTFIVFVIFRSFLFSITATFLSAEFGFDNFGKLIGITFCIGGGFGFLAQPLLILGLETFNRDFTIPGLIVLGVTLLQMTFPILYSYYRGLNLKRVKSRGNEGYISPYIGKSPKT